MLWYHLPCNWSVKQYQTRRSTKFSSHQFYKEIKGWRWLLGSPWIVCWSESYHSLQCATINFARLCSWRVIYPHFTANNSDGFGFAWKVHHCSFLQESVSTRSFHAFRPRLRVCVADIWHCFARTRWMTLLVTLVSSEDSNLFHCSGESLEQTPQYSSFSAWCCILFLFRVRAVCWKVNTISLTSGVYTSGCGQTRHKQFLLTKCRIFRRRLLP